MATPRWSGCCYRKEPPISQIPVGLRSVVIVAVVIVVAVIVVVVVHAVYDIGGILIIFLFHYPFSPRLFTMLPKLVIVEL